MHLIYLTCLPSSNTHSSKYIQLLQCRSSHTTRLSSSHHICNPRNRSSHIPKQIFITASSRHLVYRRERERKNVKGKQTTNKTLECDHKCLEPADDVGVVSVTCGRASGGIIVAGLLNIWDVAKETEPQWAHSALDVNVLAKRRWVLER
jgi:hypothetical protein